MECLDNLEYFFWFKDWTQKILPSILREKQSDYFGKKDMSLHVDVFFQRKEIAKLTKLVYFTVICSSDYYNKKMLASCVVSDILQKSTEMLRQILNKLLTDDVTENKLYVRQKKRKPVKQCSNTWQLIPRKKCN